MVVLIACDHDDTLLRLREYLLKAGLEARATRSLAEAMQPNPELDALVLFPDDFDTGKVTDGLLRLLGAGSSTLVVLVTADSQSFESFLAGASSTRWVVMPQPVWGWTILDVLRGSIEARA